MRRILRFLFPVREYCVSESWLLLLLRLLFGILLMAHGIAKWSEFSSLSAVFPDPLGLGGRVSLSLSIFAELFCAAGFVVGAFYRLALIPMIFNMCVAFFVVHGGDPFSARELALIYLAVFTLLFFTGPGTFALDRLIGRSLRVPRQR